MLCVAWRHRVIAIGVGIKDLAVGPMDDQLDALVLGEVPSLLDRLILRSVRGRNTLGAFPANRPAAVMRHDVVILFGHEHLLDRIEIGKGSSSPQLLIRGDLNGLGKNIVANVFEDHVKGDTYSVRGGTEGGPEWLKSDS